ncbi:MULTISPECIES: cytochrome c [unclassified Rhizobium]|jgi:cytochrome c556|uniref:c-type cytochrome n=1 Tax=unclassified Rhizobium TaxID=2613769 RepID=UPI00160C93AE|nr:MULTISPECIES: cytochrome c [unclassified Rhizobium]MBB3314491.1 cytochrome c556 [Rhizobium sp. BK181]MBB3539828.1 cytochrome c556 [Rhizobium sp. BK399]MCS3739163.1 cytochrome c556 [Rhizobium sp. BK661]MCS4090513.1 cytochrome c556 [Rhizobium sp. BK176]
MRLKAIAAAVLVAGLGVVGVAIAAQEDGTHEARSALMKKVGGAAGAMAAIAKGEKPYDAEVVKASLMTIAETAKVFPDQFKPGTEKGDKAASPKIWEDHADFKARAAKLSDDADKLLAQLPADPAGVGAAMKALGANCGGCHEKFRIKTE